MEPFYFYITALTLVAGRLIYDTFFRTRKAKETLLEIVQLQDEIKENFKRGYSIEYQPHLELEPNKNIGCFAKASHAYNRITIQLSNCENLKKTFLEQCDNLPHYCRHNLILKLFDLEKDWLNKKSLKRYHLDFTECTKRYIAEYYNSTNLAMIEFTREFFAENTVERIERLDGTTIDHTKIMNDLGKCNLNKKLHNKLPPKPKAKVNKI